MLEGQIEMRRRRRREERGVRAFEGRSRRKSGVAGGDEEFDEVDGGLLGGDSAVVEVGEGGGGRVEVCR